MLGGARGGGEGHARAKSLKTPQRARDLPIASQTESLKLLLVWGNCRPRCRVHKSLPFWIPLAAPWHLAYKQQPVSRGQHQASILAQGAWSWLSVQRMASAPGHAATLTRSVRTLSAAPALEVSQQPLVWMTSLATSVSPSLRQESVGAHL